MIFFCYRNVLKHTEEYLNEMEEIANLYCGSWSKIYEDVKIKQEKFVPFRNFKSVIRNCTCSTLLNT